ncbi:hypothetical protein JTE90_023894 [Oedothorax gibbosus]|uniref:Nucleoprotein TPR n=1 Tax=Oedothorax gibbosus TaxID=931172 RepID=A0AAV6UNX3_9ARAC|nr:hypothetical protein JTE90_023894 [Oedothorax gibbosus]
MECCAKLESFLNEQELSSLSETAKSKIEDELLNLSQLVTELRNENSELNVVLESEQFKFEKEISASRQQLQSSTESCTKLKLQIAELEENAESVQKQLRELQKAHDSSTLELQSVKRNNELLNQEKRNLTEQLEKRRNEIEKLNSDLQNLLDQVTSANEAKFEAIAASEESKLRESNLQHQVHRLEQEKDLQSRQISDLHAELTQKNSEIHTLKREKSTNGLELKTMLEDRADEIHMVQKRLDCYKEMLEEKDLRIEALAEKIRQCNQNHSKAEEQFNLELAAQAKLIEIHKNASEGNQMRVQELMSAFEETQLLLKQSSGDCEKKEQRCHEIETRCKIQLEEKKSEISQLKEELRKARESYHGITADTIEKIFPVAAATSKVLHSGMTLTELYAECVRLQEELQQQKFENTNLNRELKQIISEIEEKTPIINQRMEEYSKLNEMVSSLKSQLANAQVDLEKILEERNDAKRMCNLAGRENNRLKTQVIDLNRQVQVLLKEVEEARGGMIKTHRDKSLMFEEEVTSSNDSTAAEVISRHLVTFRDIEELQTRNQQLLAAIRDLSQQHEETEKKVSSEISSKFENEIHTLSLQLEDLQKKRSRQSDMLETIIRQRDMYRVLLTSQGYSESLLGSAEGCASPSPMNSSFSPDPQLKEAKGAMNQLQVEFNNYKKEKAENERMLNELVDKMRADVSDLRIQNAKLAGQVDYSEERVKILQSNLENFKKEHASVKDKNRQHSSLIVQHQHTINSLRQDLMVAHEKIAKSDVTIENLKAERDLLKGVEARLLQEKESVVREQQHQSRMMANLQAVQNNLERIESETKRNLEYQVEKLEKDNSILKTKLENANEEYRSAVNIWEKQKKEMQSKVDAELERNRKLQDDLISAYSQMHTIQQNLSTPEKKSPAASPALKTPVKPTNAASKPPIASPQVSAEVKLLKEQLNEAQAKIKSVQDKLTLTSKTAEQYLSMCKDLELRVKEQDEINKHLKDSMDKALDSNKDARVSMEKNVENLEKSNRDLIEENMKLTQESNLQINELQKKLMETTKLIDDYKNQAEVAKKTADQAREDCQNQINLMQDVQSKYERELMLHAQDMQTLTKLKEEHEKCSAKISELSEKSSVAEQLLADSKESWTRQESIWRSEIEAAKAKSSDLELCNQNLHQQLELMGTQMAALQSKNWEDSPYSTIQSDLKDTQHLLQVIQFIKKEKEIASTQFDMAQSENVRLNLKVEQLNHDLNSAKSELKEIMNNLQAKAASEAQHAELLKKIERFNLLSESNNLLRMEKESLQEEKMKLEAQLQELNEKFQPMNEKEKELIQNIEMLTVENNSLKNEVKSWQSRTNQLLEQSHRIGPQEYKNMLHELEELKSQKGRLAEELQRKQAEISKLSSALASLKKDLEQSKAENAKQVDVIAKLNEASAEHQKTMLQVKRIGRKYKTQFDELQVTYDALLAKSKAAEASNQEQTVQELQKKLEASEKVVKELQEEMAKKNQLLEQAKKDIETVQARANEKEEKAKKLLAQFRTKYAQMNGQREALTNENKKLAKDVEEFKTKLSTIQTSQEETSQMKMTQATKMALMEKELKKQMKSSVLLKKQNDELLQKLSQQKQVGLGERSSSGTEPLTANIKPLTSPSTSAASSGVGLRHQPAANVNRPTPTASIRPMAIGTAQQSAQQTQRTATVLPTAQQTAHAEEETVLVQINQSVSVPHATVQPTPATATVAPTTMAVTVSPVISEVSPTIVQEEAQPAQIPSMHVAGSPVSQPATALVPPRIDISESIPEAVPVDSPSPTTSVIVSPPATQTQVVTPTVKRRREDSPGTSDSGDGSMKRIRMVSEGSQTNQQHPTSVVTPTNIAVVPAAQVVTRNQSQSLPVKEPSEPSTSQQMEVKEPVAVEVSVQPVITSTVDVGEIQELVPASNESVETEILEEDREDLQIELEPQEEMLDEEFEAEGMEEAAVDEGEEEVEEMLEIGGRSPDDEDMPEEQTDDTEEMLDTPTPAASDIDILDSTSDNQMDADSGGAIVNTEMAPPPFPPTLEIPPTPEAPQLPPRAPLATGPPRLERQAPVSRQHLTPFTIPGQGSNFEEGDDGIVPSTPTLYVPRRTDGFAEAVSSPHVPQVRFLFNSSDSSPTQQGLSQLASQGALGVDDTRMDLSQFDEGGRTVPSTPVQVSPPVEVNVVEGSSSVLESSANVPSNELIIPIIKVELAEDSLDTAISGTEGDVSDLQQPGTSEGSAELTTSETTPEDSSDKSVLQSEAAEISSSDETRTEEASLKVTEQASKDPSTSAPQRKPIVWKGDSPPAPEQPSVATEVPVADPNLLPTPTRGRNKSRRSRYGTSYTRGGRGAQHATTGTTANWQPPTAGRRGRGSARRARMY